MIVLLCVLLVSICFTNFVSVYIYMGVFLHLVYYLETIFGHGLGTSTLESPPFTEKSKTCLRFMYLISSPKIVLNIFVKTTPGSDFKLINMVEFSDQEMIDHRSYANVELGDGVTQFRMVADKKGISTDIHYVQIDSVELTRCPTTGKI